MRSSDQLTALPNLALRLDARNEKWLQIKINTRSEMTRQDTLFDVSILYVIRFYNNWKSRRRFTDDFRAIVTATVCCSIRTQYSIFNNYIP